MSSPEIRAWVAASRAAQGLPPTVQDPGALERVAAIFRLVDPVVSSPRKHRAPATHSGREATPA